MTADEAEKRLKAQGAAYEITRVEHRKKVLGETEPRVMRVRETDAAFELLVGEFRVFQGDRAASAREDCGGDIIG